MAANKKKKKLAVNSARGFATTSTPSKPKSQDIADAQQAPDSTEDKEGESSPIFSPANSTSVEEPRPSFHEASPEQLEKHFEESDLLLFIDKNGENTKKIVSRQASKLRTERRLLRAQADHMKSRLWLPAEVRQLIIDRLVTPGKGSDVSWSEPGYYQSPSNPFADEFLIRMWALYQLLPQIGFSDFQREHALRELLRREHTGTLPLESGGKDSIWGLIFCLDWFARFASSEEALLYDDSAISRPLNPRIAPSTRDNVTIDNAPKDLNSRTPSSQGKSDYRAASSDVDTLSEPLEVTSEPESDVGSDLEPDEMITKYLALMTRRFHISTENDEQDDIKRKKQKSQDPPTSLDRRKTARLDSKIASIRSDILFDEDEASRQWSAKRISLARESADRKRLGIGATVGVDVKDNESKTNIPTSADEEVEEEASMLGELFSGLPDTTPDDDGYIRLTGLGGPSVKVKDFGNWNGMSPRRILEEACRARYVGLYAIAIVKYLQT